MKKTLASVFVSLLVFCELPGRLLAQPPGGSPFDRFDANKDGKLSRDEVPDFLRERFSEIDRDKDGSISRDEDRAFLAARPGRGGPGGPGRTINLPAGVKIERNIAYAGTDNPRQTLDLLLPRERKGNRPLPVVVAIHGGAFRMGEKAMALGEIVSLVASGDYAGVTINYRLSQEAVWPAQIHDCKAAIRWVRGNASKHHLDPDRIGVIGSSAGGHLAATLGTSVGLSSLEGTLGEYRNQSSKVQCVVDQFGPSDLLAMNSYPGQMDHDAPDSPESQLIGGSLQENKEKARAASPISYVSPDDPPFLIVHGTKDPLVPFNQSERLAAALRNAGVKTLFIPVVDAGHGGFRSPEVPGRIRGFLDRHLRGQDEVSISEEPIGNQK